MKTSLGSPGWITFVLLACATSLTAGDWPQWRGPNRTGHAADGPALATLPKDAKPVWKLSIGTGFSSPILAGNKLVYLDEQNGKEVAHAVDPATGKEIWHAEFSDSFGDNWGSGPRSTPFIDGDRVYMQSCSGEFSCLNLADGKLLWKTSYEKDFGVKFLGSKSQEGTATRRGNNGCGVISGDRLVLPVGSTKGASLVCFDKMTGKVLWKAGNDEAAYSSFIVATLAGVQQVVAFTAEALLGADLATGKILWRVPLRTGAKRHAATPLIIGDTVIVNSQTIGMLCFKISSENGELKAAPAWTNKDLRINLSTAVLVGDYLYCQGPRKDYVCVEAKTGALKWSRPGFGQGEKDNSSTIVAGNKLLVLTENGTLVLLEPNPAQCTEVARLQVCGNTWAFPAYADGRIYVRDSRQLQCLDLTAP